MVGMGGNEGGADQYACMMQLMQLMRQLMRQLMMQLMQLMRVVQTSSMHDAHPWVVVRKLLIHTLLSPEGLNLRLPHD